MKNKNLLITIFVITLVAVGGYFVFKIPPPQISGNIESADTNTLGAEASVVDASATTSADMNDKLEMIDEVVGTGLEAAVGKSVTVNYAGTLTNGTKFDSSYDRNEPFTFKLGAGEVIVGWDQGVVGMKVGGKRKLIIPPSLGYGAQDMGPIPANSTLIFEIELLKVE